MIIQTNNQSNNLNERIVINFSVNLQQTKNIFRGKLSLITIKEKK